jgi:Tfp pilus assembly protein FimT
MTVAKVVAGAVLRPSLQSRRVSSQNNIRLDSLVLRLDLQEALRTKMMIQRRNHSRQHERGFSIVETLIVITISMILAVIAIPQMVAQRRLIRSAGINREIMTSLRYARQLAMSQSRATPTGALARVAYTFQYDDTLKEIKIIGPIPAGTAALADGSYPNNTGSGVVFSSRLTQGGLPSQEIIYGIPAGTDLPNGAPIIPTGALGDGVSMTALASNKVNITFQPDGSVMDSTGAALDRSLFFYNKKVAQHTASAISVLGTSGRIKVWRYVVSGNAYTE